MVNYGTEMIATSFIRGGKTTLNPTWNTKNVICPESKLYYVIDGEICIKLDSQLIVAKKGDMVLIPAGIKHDFFLSKKNYAKKFWIHFDIKIGNFDYFEKLILPYKITVGKNAYIEKLFETILSNANRRDMASRTTVSGAICYLVAFFEKGCRVVEKNEEDNEINKVIEYIRQNYAKDIDLSELAEKANLSMNYFVRKFKEKTGYSPMRYLTSVRIELAEYMLQNTNESITTIMEKVSFLDSSHFSKTFKQYSGYSPKRYREIYKDKPYNANKIILDK